MRRNSITVADREADDFFIRLSLDTEPFGPWFAMDRYFKGERFVQKPWTGYVSKDRTKFKVRRTGVGIFRSGVSMFEICGRLTLNNNGKIIEIKIRPAWFVVLNLIGVAGFLGFVTWNIFNDMIGWTVCILVVAVQILFILLDLSKTEDRLIDYIDKYRK